MKLTDEMLWALLAAPWHGVDYGGSHKKAHPHRVGVGL